MVCGAGRVWSSVARVRLCATLALLAGAAGCARDRPSPYLVELGGELRFQRGDDAAWADPRHDDSAWRQVRLPAVWRSLDVATYGWYRAHFELAPELARPGLALDLGVVAWADEVFLNGRRIAGSGRMHRLPSIAYMPRLYPLPPDLVRAGQNLLAVRVRGWPIANAGLLAQRIGIGDERELLPGQHDALARTMAAEAVLMGFLLFGWLVLLFLPKRGTTGRATLFLWASVSMQLAVLWLFSVTARNLELAPDVSTKLGSVAASLGMSALWAFVATLVRGRVPRLLLVPMAGFVICAFGVLVSDGLVVVASFVGGACAIGGMAATVALLVRGVRARIVGAVPLLVGIGIAAAGNATMIFLVGNVYRSGVAAFHYGLLCIAAAAMLALTLNVRDMNRVARQVSAYALEAHTRERRRLSRDLHDGLGQMLALLKLSLQRTGARIDDATARGAVADGVVKVDTTLQELRRIARDLRPTPLEDRRFGEAVREYAASVSGQSDVEVVVEGDFRDPLRDGVGDELYRVVQESLTNCVKHSGARQVTIALSDADGQFRLTVTDDGRGLSGERPASAGLGLMTIRERTQLLGGSCTIGAAPGGGTRVAVSVPK